MQPLPEDVDDRKQTGFTETGGKIVGCFVLIAAMIASLALIVLAFKFLQWSVAL